MRVSRLVREAEVGGGELQEVYGDEEEGFPEVGPAPDVDEAEDQQVVGDEVRGEVTGVLDVFGGVFGRGVEGGEVGDLDGEEDDPGTGLV